MASSRNEDGPDVRVRHAGHVKKLRQNNRKTTTVSRGRSFFFLFKYMLKLIFYRSGNFYFSFVFVSGIVC